MIVQKNGCVILEDFTEFMDFPEVLRDADTDEVQLILAVAFVKSEEIRSRLGSEESAVAVAPVPWYNYNQSRPLSQYSGI